MPWWGWVISGFVLLATELFIPCDFFLIFIGLAGIITGGAVYAGVLEPYWLQWTVAAVLSLILCVFVRRNFVDSMTRNSEETKTDLVGKQVHLLENIAPGQVGKGEIRGANWQVRNDGSGLLKKDERPVIARIDGLKLIVGEEVTPQV